jgi:hypothetical protein
VIKKIKRGHSVKIKNIIFLIFILFIITVLSSCPQDLVKGSVWNGTITNSVNYDSNLDAYFQPDNTMKIYFDFAGKPGVSYSATGSYTLSNANSLQATLQGNGYFEGPTDVTLDNFTISVDGVLNNSTGIGSGNYELKANSPASIQIYYDKGTWQLSKIKSN